jgi:hypothetical protein
MDYILKRLLKYMSSLRSTKYEKHRKIVWAIIAEFGGSTTFSQLGEQWTWVKFYGMPESLTPVLNLTSLREAGTRVLVARDPRPPRRWRIISIDDSASSVTSQIPFSQFSVGIHGMNHQIFDEAIPGSDPMYVGQPMLMPLKTTGDGATLVVTVGEYAYTINGAYRLSSQQNIDLTSHVPGTASKVRTVLIYLDRDANSLKVVDGTIVDDDGFTPIPEPPPPTDVDARESAWVTLANAQSTITTAADIKDARDFLDNGSSSGIPTPTNVGDLLMYLDGGVQWVTPLISEDDIWMTNDDGELLIEG